MLDSLKSIAPWLTLASIVAGLGGAWATSQARAAQAENAIGELRSRLVPLEQHVQAHDVGLAVIQEDVKALRQGMDRLESKLGTRR